MTAPLNLPGFPSPLSWETPPAHFVLEDGGGVQMRAAPRTDFFLDPRGGIALTNSARLLFTPTRSLCSAPTPRRSWSQPTTQQC